MKIFSKKEFGDFGEALAKKYLKGKGLKFIEKNFKFYNKEIDLIFCDKKCKTIIFVEVKSRTSKVFGEPELAINRYKQANIRQGAKGFLMKNNEFEDYDIRFDSVTIFKGEGEPVINHIENAF